MSLYVLSIVADPFQLFSEAEPIKRQATPAILDSRRYCIVMTLPPSNIMIVLDPETCIRRLLETNWNEAKRTTPKPSQCVPRNWLSGVVKATSGQQWPGLIRRENPWRFQVSRPTLESYRKQLDWTCRTQQPPDLSRVSLSSFLFGGSYYASNRKIHELGSDLLGYYA